MYVFNYETQVLKCQKVANVYHNWDLKPGPACRGDEFKEP